MPYNIRKDQDEFCVYNTETGEKKGCSATRPKALAHMRALYAAENKDLTNSEIDDLVKEVWRAYCLESGDEFVEEFVDKALEEPLDEKMAVFGFMSPGVTSYAELEAQRAAQEAAIKAQDLFAEFPMLASNIFAAPDIDDKRGAIIRLGEELAEIVPEAIREEIADEKAISRREDVSEAERKRAQAEYGDVTYADSKNKKYPIDTVAHIRAAWSYINMPRNAAKYSSSDLATIKARIIRAWKKKINPAGPPKVANKSLLEKAIEAITSIFDNTDAVEPEPDSSGMLITKNASGDYVWIARYSNKWRDRDAPPEIISSASHRRFAELVDKGLAPYPELWLWHVKDWRIGQATWVAYDDAGFAMAAGRPLPGCEPVFEWMEKNAHDLGVSHGMPRGTIRRDYVDPTIIVEHETREISPLPAAFQANQLADFVAFGTKDVEEDDMAIPKEKKREILTSLGLDEEILNAVENLNISTAKEADEAGIQSKEKDSVDDGVPDPEVDGALDQVETEDKPKVDDTPEKDPADLPPTRKELAEALSPYVNQASESADAVKALSTRIDALEKKIDTLVTQLVGKSTPAALAALLAGSAVGDPNARLKDGDELGDNKPKESNATPARTTGIQFIDEMLAS